jgi:hypothetical protein
MVSLDIFILINLSVIQNGIIRENIKMSQIVNAVNYEGCLITDICYFTKSTNG